MTEQEEKIVIGHRGSRGLKPENTIPAFLQAIKLGAKGLEMDLYITGDGRVVVTHDATISADICQSPEGKPLDDAEGKRLRIFGLGLNEIKPFDCGSEPNPDFPEQQNMEAHIPLLSEIIGAVNQKASNKLPVRYYMELKSDPATDGIYHPEPAEFVEKVLEVVYKHKIQQHTLIMSFDKRCLKEVKKQASEISIGLPLEEEGQIQLHLDELGFVPDAVFPYFKIVNEAFVGFCKTKNMKIYPWTVNDEKDMLEIIRHDINGLITDYPDKALRLLNGKA